MLDGIPIANMTGVTALTVIATLVITRRLIWHTDLRKAEDRAQEELKKETARGDRWEGIALRALGVAEKMTVHAEVVNEVVSAIPTAATQPQESPPPTITEAGP